MDIVVEVLKVELKGTPSFELLCKAETDTNDEILVESSSVDLGSDIAPPPRPKVTKSKTRVRIEEPHLAKFRFCFKNPSPVAALLFTAVKTGASQSSTHQSSSAAVGGGSGTITEAEGEIGQCFFPITFRPSSVINMGSLGLKADEMANQTQTGFLTRKLGGMNVNKVVGRIFFKVINQKRLPKKSLLKSQSSYLDLKISQDKFAKPVKSGPLVTDLDAREKALSCRCATMPGDNPVINVIFHCAASAQEEQLKDLHPIACLGTSTDIREDAFFKDNSGHEVRVASILRPVSLRCDTGNDESNKEVLEVHLSGGRPCKALFSAAHTVEMFYPFKHYNWEYNWRWLPGTQTSTLDNFQSNSKESKVILSVVYVPKASDFAEYEGLEVLIQQLDLEAFAKDRNLIACVELEESDEVVVSLGGKATAPHNSPFKWNSGSHDTLSNRNFNIALMQFNNAESEQAATSSDTAGSMTPAYFFFAINPFFRSKSYSHTLKFTLYSIDRSSPLVWWRDSNVASSSILLPQSLKTILPNPENRGGVRCDLLKEDVAQPEEMPLIKRMTVLLRWKVKEMQFLSQSVENVLNNLPKLQDLVYSQETSLCNVQFDDLHQPQVYLDEYKTAITKMGIDILKLRQENEQLSKENKRLERHMLETEASIVVTAADQRNLQPLSKADLIHRIVELSEHFTGERQSRKRYQDKVRTLQNQLIEKNDVVSRHVRLQEAHEAQQKLVRELQSKVEKYRKCGETSRKQEVVINQLEALLALEAGEHREGNALSIISKENADLRAALKEYQDFDPNHRRSLLEEKEETIASLRKELEKKTRQFQTLEEQLREKNSHVKSETFLEQTTRVYELEQKLKVAQARESTLMKELEENGRRWAKEKARYEEQLTELQAKLEALKMGQTVATERGMVSPLSLEPSRPLLAQYTSNHSDSSSRQYSTF